MIWRGLTDDDLPALVGLARRQGLGGAVTAKAMRRMRAEGGSARREPEQSGRDPYV